jgi:predicted RND superfamily exporter protein
MDERNLTWKSKLPRFSTDHPGIIFSIVLLATALALAVTPWIQINTDPEDMLPEDHPIRVQNDEIKDRFILNDIVAIAIEANDTSREQSLERLKRVKELIDHIKQQDGVISQDIISLYTSDDIEGISGGINIDRMLRSPPSNQEELNHLKERLKKHPILEGMVYNPETGGLAVYVPVEKKKFSYTVRTAAQDFWADVPKNVGKLHVTGLPVAEETFGVEMFKQMAISAPMAFVVIGLLMYWFFQSLSLVLWSLLLAVFTVVITMGSLIGLGFPVHIMSSMIPIFLMPIAVVDSIHILSDFTERLTPDSDAKTVMAGVYEDIFYPILFTSITSASGFISLVATGIPPVEVFGVAVGFGILLAFLLTLVVLPAGASVWQPGAINEGEGTLLARLLNCPPDGFCLSRDHPRTVVLVLLALLGVGIYGMTLIEVNDNPTRWFFEDHPIRQADEYINRTFAGSYPAYMVLSKEKKDGWTEPESLQKLGALGKKIESMDEVGKVTALDDLVSKIHHEILKQRASEPLPSSARAVSQYLFLYENSGNPQDLFRLVTQNADQVNLWFNLKSGDNKAMARVKQRTESLLDESGLELSESPEWAGITYVNLVWQNVMVNGMAWALAGGYVVVFLMMLLLFRSFVWSLLSLIPLTVTLIFVYGLVGWVGKAYDMPIAVLSSLSIGIAVDFAIHFIQRGRQLIDEHGSWPEAREHISGEPSRAIARNAIVIAIGFTPLLFAPLRPYLTVGVFMILIMSFSGLATLIGLNAVVEWLHQYLPLRRSD